MRKWYDIFMQADVYKTYWPAWKQWAEFIAKGLLINASIGEKVASAIDKLEPAEKGSVDADRPITKMQDMKAGLAEIRKETGNQMQLVAICVNEMGWG